jgi:antitoxin CcdA
MRILYAHEKREEEPSMLSLYDSHAPRKATNLSINSDLLNKTKELDINLSATLEQALAAILKQKQRDRWLEENRDAIRAYNTHVEKYGVFSDDLRSF